MIFHRFEVVETADPIVVTVPDGGPWRVMAVSIEGVAAESSGAYAIVNYLYAPDSVMLHSQRMTRPPGGGGGSMIMASIGATPMNDAEQGSVYNLPNIWLPSGTEIYIQRYDEPSLNPMSVGLLIEA